MRLLVLGAIIDNDLSVYVTVYNKNSQRVHRMPFETFKKLKRRLGWQTKEQFALNV
jgi:hypothetical protein